jgi:hypothetical protein
MKAETIARALGGRKAGAGWMTRCPAHDDHEPSDDGAQGQRHADINSGNTATATGQQPRIRNGNASRCEACAAPLKPKRGSRRQRYCDYECRDRARRDRNFAGSGATRKSPGYPVENISAVSNTYKSKNAGRAFPINLIGGYRWPGRNGVDPDLARTIVRTEIGASSIVPRITSDNACSRQQTESGSAEPNQAGDVEGER